MKQKLIQNDIKEAHYHFKPSSLSTLPYFLNKWGKVSKKKEVASR